MDLHLDTYSPTPIRRPGAEAPHERHRGWRPIAEPGTADIPELADSSGINPSAVTRAIKDLRRSGYRPLRARPAALRPFPGAPRARRAMAWTAKRTACPGSRNLVKEDES